MAAQTDVRTNSSEQVVVSDTVYPPGSREEISITEIEEYLGESMTPRATCTVRLKNGNRARC
jgi:hypothetical protein